MPPAVGAIVTAAVSGAVAYGSGIAFLGLAAGWTAAAVAAGGTLLFSFASSALTPKPSSPDFSGGFAAEAQGRTQTLRQPITVRRLVFGVVRTGGALTYYAATDSNRYHHMVIYLCQGPIAGIDTIWLNDTPVYPDQIDEDGAITSGPFAGKVRLKRHLGATDQAADADLIAEVDALDSNFRGQGVAYLYARVDWDRDTFPNGLPNFKADVRGAVVADPRSATTRWTQNVALQLRHYALMSKANMGLGFTADEIDTSFGVAQANLADEIADCAEVAAEATTVSAADDHIELDDDVCPFQWGDRVTVASTGTLPGGLSAGTDYFVIVRRPAETPRIALATSLIAAEAGTAIDITDAGTGTLTITKDGEPRYASSYLLETDKEPQAIVQDLLRSGAGMLTYPGRWVLRLGAWTEPVLHLDENDLIDTLKVRTRHSRSDRYNGVKGTYVSPLNAGEASEYPSVQSAEWLAADDGEEIYLDYDLPGVSRAGQAQRVVSTLLEGHRRELTAESTFSLRALGCAPGETITLGNRRRGWSAKTFQVARWNLTVIDGQDEGLTLGVFLELRETDSDVYVWNAAAETAPSPAARLTRPAWYSVPVPADLAAASGTAHLFTKADGTVVSRIAVTFTAPTDRFISSGGRIEVQFRKTGSGDTWQDRRLDDPGQAIVYLEPVQDGDDFDIRARAVNVLGQRSAWSSTITHTVVGKTEPPANVTGFSAQQNGGVVAFKWTAITDADRAGYGIRYAPQGGFVWADATPVTDELIARGTTITTALVPPGTWTFGIKAYDTSGNESAAAATVNLTVVNAFDIVFTEVEEPDWLGARTDMVKHWTGVLVPASQGVAADDGWDTFDTFVPNPVAVARYEAPEIDLGFDATGVRIWGEIASRLGPGETTGTADPVLEIDTRTASGSYGGFQPWTIGTRDFRYAKARLTVNTAAGLPVIIGFSPVCDVQERTESRSGLSVPDTGLAVTFADRFHGTPHVVATADGTERIAYKSAVSETGFTLWIYDASTGLPVSGTGGYDATGA